MPTALVVTGLGHMLALEWFFTGMNISDESWGAGWTAGSTAVAAVAGIVLALEWLFMDVNTFDESWGTGGSAES